MNLTDLTNFIIALAIGGLIGLEREIYQQRKKRGFAGIRTYIVVAFLGAICSFLVQKGDWAVFGYIILAGVILLLIASYYASAVRGFMGMTTELSVILVYVLSTVAMIEKYQKMAVIFGVLLAAILSMKSVLHSFARKTKQIEWFDALKFVFMVFVILPLLPNQELTLLGVEGAFNPYQTWLMIIFVSGVSFVGYFLAKVVGGAHGIGLTGVLGGLVSSTAVTQSMANDSKKHPKLVAAYAFAAISASVIKCFRVLFEAWTIDSLMISKYAVAVLAVAVVGIMFITRWIGPAEAKDGDGKICIGSPLSLKPAIVFGLLYSFTVFVTRLMVTNEISNLGFGVLGMVSGMADIDAITLSMSNLFLQGAVSDITAWTTIVIAVISNLLFKALLARIFGSNKYFRIVSTALVVMALVGAIFAGLSLR